MGKKLFYEKESWLAKEHKYTNRAQVAMVIALAVCCVLYAVVGFSIGQSYEQRIDAQKVCVPIVAPGPLCHVDMNLAYEVDQNKILDLEAVGIHNVHIVAYMGEVPCDMVLNGEITSFKAARVGGN